LTHLFYKAVDSNTVEILVGDSDLSGTENGDNKAAGEGYSENASGMNGDFIDATQIYFRANGAAGQQLRIKTRTPL
jgi:hypothetical protein